MDSNFVYVVVSISDSDLEICEIYNNPQIATYHAFKLAQNKSLNHPEWLISNPLAEKLEDGTVRWTFLETSKNLVSLLLKSVLETTKNFTDTKSLPVMPSVISKPVDDPFEKSLPGGFTYDGKPVNMDYVISHPDDVVLPLSLTSEQQLALVTARIRKRPNYSLSVYGFKLEQFNALDEIKNKTYYLKDLVKAELTVLDNYISSLLNEEG